MNGASWNRHGRAGIFCFAMTRKTHLALTAGSAIAAALALAPVPLLAQDVMVPTIDASPAAPLPADPVVAPAPEPVMTSSPVVQDVSPETAPAEASETAARPAAPAATVRTAPAPVRQAAPVDRAAAQAPEAVIPATGTAAPDEVVAVPVAPVAVEPAPATAETGKPANDPSNMLLPILLAAIVAAGLAIWGFVAVGRRQYGKAAVPVVERPVVARPQPQWVAVQPAAARVTPLASPRPAEPLSHSGAAVALPREAPKTYAERNALLERMIAARPDRANPFRSRKARARRAKLIIGSLGRDFSQVEPRIDLSQYSSNWPSQARKSVAA